MNKIQEYVLLAAIILTSIALGWSMTISPTTQSLDLDIEIYTAKNIHYIDFKTLKVTNEQNSQEIQFKSLEELKEYISDITAAETDCIN